MVQLMGESVNFSISDGELFSRLMAIRGHLVFISAQTWDNESVKPRLSILSAVSKTTAKNGSITMLPRQLSIAVRSSRYEAQIRLEGNEVD